MLFRASAATDLDRVLALIEPDPATGAVTAARYAEKLASGEFTAARTWLAETSDGEAVGVACWWSENAEAPPRALDGLFVRASDDAARTEVAAGLLNAAHAAFAAAGVTAPPELHLFLPADWHDRPDVAAAVGWRRQATARAGLAVARERLRYEWRSGVPVPARSSRLRFAAEPDDEVFVRLFARVVEGTLDVESREGSDRLGAEAQAREDVAVYRDLMRGDRSWWRVAYDDAGEAVGFALPSANPDGPVVGYLGVLPEHRGHGYVDDLLAEITAVLVDGGAERIRADTDLPNRPMAAAFERAGYVQFARRLVVSATPPVSVRRLTPGDWELARDVRLGALAEAPAAFGSTLAAQQARTEAEWREYLTPSMGVRAVAERNGAPVGIVGAFRRDGEGRDGRRADGEMIWMWVDPAHRGTGVGEALVAYVLDWCRAEGVVPMLWIAEGNEGARRLYERCGYALTGVRQPLPHDETRDELEMRYAG